MNPLLRIRAALERLRTSLWVLPSIAVVLAVVVGTALTTVAIPADSPWADVVYGGGAGGAQQLLSAIAGATIAVIGTVFSLTVVALQLASAQYSPRLLRNFLRKRGNQGVLSVFLGTFAYCLAVLRTVREASTEEQTLFVPALAVTVAMLLALLAVGWLVWFIHHITQSIRIETIVREVEHDTVGVVDRVYDEPWRDDAVTALPEPPGRAVSVPAPRSGHLQEVALTRLLDDVRDAGLVVRLRSTYGDYVVAGAPLAWVWPLDPGGSADSDTAAALLAERVQVGAERSTARDVGYGMRQLADIAAKALSPGVNDPTTAVQTVGPLTTILVRLAGRRLDHDVERDADGTIRVVVPRPGFAAYLALATEPLRHHGADQPTVVRAVLRLLDDVSAVTPSPRRRAIVADHLDRLVRDVEREVPLDVDVAELRDVAASVREGLRDGGRPGAPVPAE